MIKKPYWYVLVFTLFLSTSAHAESQAMVCGDVSGDGQVTASDALRVLIKSVGLDPEMRCNNRRNYQHYSNAIWCDDEDALLKLDCECLPEPVLHLNCTPESAD